MAVVENGIAKWCGMPLGRVEGIKEGTVIDIDYDRPQIVDLAKGV